MGHTWKTREETFHGSKWGYAVVALVIGIILFLMWTIFAALKGYPFIEFLPPSTAVFFGMMFLFYALLGGSVVITGGKTWTLSLVGNPFVIAIFTVLGASMLLVLLGGSAMIIAVAAVLLMIILFIFAWRGIIIIAASGLATLVFIVSIVVYISIIVMLGYTIPTVNVIVALLAFVLLLIFVPFAIFIIDLFSYEHE